MNFLFDIISVPLGWIMRSIYNLVGNYGVSLILFTLVTKILMFPLAIKQKKSMIRMNAFQPVIQNIQKKYANDPAKQQQELARLQQEHGFSMTSGCLPMVIQMPIFIGLIQVIYSPLRHIFGIARDLSTNTLRPIAAGIVGELSKYSPETGIIKAIQSAPEAFAGVLEAPAIERIQNFNLTFLGMDLAGTPSFKVFNTLLLIPILSVLFMVLQQWLMTKLNGQQTNAQTTVMMGVSALMFGYFAFILPAGVSIYWIFTSVFGIAQELILRIFFDPEKEKQKIEDEIVAARKARKEQAKHKPVKTKAERSDKYVEDTFENEEEAEKARKRLEKARALDKEKYGE